ncbi:uncharacterized protein LOC111519762 [Drosophila willistoni]|uniref:uncharacterized protein LOC111519762 n=1 Tax=Drosophila willistoni TaxID=7260 RepID=UPI000C26C2C4|nr:uncharacterized protein LOC111519762 [Drosophila willistoni]
MKLTKFLIFYCPIVLMMLVNGSSGNLDHNGPNAVEDLEYVDVDFKNNTQISVGIQCLRKIFEIMSFRISETTSDNFPGKSDTPCGDFYRDMMIHLFGILIIVCIVLLFVQETMDLLHIGFFFFRDIVPRILLL